MDRLRRPLGTFEKVDGDFKIVPRLAGGLIGIKTHHSTLDEAITAIAHRLGGAFSFNSQDWG